MDFHSLRHTFISNLADSGVHPKVAQTLARHSTITLTMDRYTHANHEQLAETLGRLPRIGAKPKATNEPLVEPAIERASDEGFSDEDRDAAKGVFLASCLAKKGSLKDIQGDSERLSDNDETTPPVSRNPLQNKGNGGSALGKKMEAAPGFEPGYEGFANPCLTTWLRRPGEFPLLQGPQPTRRSRFVKCLAWASPNGCSLRHDLGPNSLAQTGGCFMPLWFLWHVNPASESHNSGMAPFHP